MAPIPTYQILKKSCNVDFTQIRFTESEVVDVLKILKLNKATGPDGISNRMLKLTHSTVSYPLTKTLYFFFNNSYIPRFMENCTCDATF